jgi:hypothetical protein
LKPFLLLDQTFFGLTLEYKPYLLKEIFVCTKHIGFSYKDTMSMPVWERRNYIEQFLEEVEYQNKQIEEQSKKSKRG